mgnify:CR=1 FL=1
MIGFASAKINIGLFVTGKRTDGFHDLESIFWPIDWCDVLEVHRASTPGIQLEIMGLPIPSDGKENLITQAYNLVTDHFDISGVHVRLLKNIPMGAGMGGGSSDGACMLKMLNEMFKLKIPHAQLLELAAELGSDCPFFILNQPAYVSGRGNQLMAVPETQNAHPGWHAVIFHPGIHISTKEAFEGVVPKPAPFDLTTLLTEPIQDWGSRIQNDFETETRHRQPAVDQALKLLLEEGAGYAQMTGTGSAVYGLFAQQSEALLAQAKGNHQGWKTHVSSL